MDDIGSSAAGGAILGAGVGAYTARKSGVGLSDLPDVAREVVVAGQQLKGAAAQRLSQIQLGESTIASLKNKWATLSDNDRLGAVGGKIQGQITAISDGIAKLRQGISVQLPLADTAVLIASDNLAAGGYGAPAAPTSASVTSDSLPLSLDKKLEAAQARFEKASANLTEVSQAKVTGSFPVQPDANEVASAKKELSAATTGLKELGIKVPKNGNIDFVSASGSVSEKLAATRDALNDVSEKIYQATRGQNGLSQADVAGLQAQQNQLVKTLQTMGVEGDLEKGFDFSSRPAGLTAAEAAKSGTTGDSKLLSGIGGAFDKAAPAIKTVGRVLKVAGPVGAAVGFFADADSTTAATLPPKRTVNGVNQVQINGVWQTDTPYFKVEDGVAWKLGDDGKYHVDMASTAVQPHPNIAAAQEAQAKEVAGGTTATAGVAPTAHASGGASATPQPPWKSTGDKVSGLQTYTRPAYVDGKPAGHNQTLVVYPDGRQFEYDPVTKKTRFVTGEYNNLPGLGSNQSADSMARTTPTTNVPSTPSSKIKVASTPSVTYDPSILVRSDQFTNSGGAIPGPHLPTHHTVDDIASQTKGITWRGAEDVTKNVFTDGSVSYISSSGKVLHTEAPIVADSNSPTTHPKASATGEYNNLPGVGSNQSVAAVARTTPPASYQPPAGLGYSTSATKSGQSYNQTLPTTDFANLPNTQPQPTSPAAQISDFHNLPSNSSASYFQTHSAADRLSSKPSLPIGLPSGVINPPELKPSYPPAYGDYPVKTKHPKPGVTITTTASGAIIEQVEGHTPYTIKKAPATKTKVAGSTNPLVSSYDDLEAAASNPNQPLPATSTPPWHSDQGWDIANASDAARAGLKPSQVLEQRRNEKSQMVFRLDNGTYQIYDPASGQTTLAGHWDLSQWDPSKFHLGRGPGPDYVLTRHNGTAAWRSKDDIDKQFSTGQTGHWHEDDRWTTPNTKDASRAGIKPGQVLEQRLNKEDGTIIFRLNDGTYQAYNPAKKQTTIAGHWDLSQWDPSKLPGYPGPGIGPGYTYTTHNDKVGNYDKTGYWDKNILDNPVDLTHVGPQNVHAVSVDSTDTHDLASAGHWSVAYYPENMKIPGKTSDPDKLVITKPSVSPPVSARASMASSTFNSNPANPVSLPVDILGPPDPSLVADKKPTYPPAYGDNPVKTEHPRPGVTITTMPSGEKVEQVEGHTPYTIKEAPANVSPPGAPNTYFDSHATAERGPINPPAYKGGAEVVKTKHPKPGVTITTTASGAIIEQVEGHTPYTIKKAPEAKTPSPGLSGPKSTTIPDSTASGSATPAGSAMQALPAGFNPLDPDQRGAPLPSEPLPGSSLPTDTKPTVSTAPANVSPAAMAEADQLFGGALAASGSSVPAQSTSTTPASTTPATAATVPANISPAAMAGADQQFGDPLAASGSQASAPASSSTPAAGTIIKPSEPPASAAPAMDASTKVASDMLGFGQSAASPKPASSPPAGPPLYTSFPVSTSKPTAESKVASDLLGLTQSVSSPKPASSPPPNPPIYTSPPMSTAAPKSEPKVASDLVGLTNKVQTPKIQTPTLSTVVKSNPALSAVAGGLGSAGPPPKPKPPVVVAPLPPKPAPKPIAFVAPPEVKVAMSSPTPVAPPKTAAVAPLKPAPTQLSNPGIVSFAANTFKTNPPKGPAFGNAFNVGSNAKPASGKKK